MSFALIAIDPATRRFRPHTPMSDDEFMRFCADQEPMRCERAANGEIILMSPTGTRGGLVETRVNRELGNWALADGRGEAFGPTTGFRLPDGSVRAADAMWVSWRRFNALSEAELDGYAPICPEFIIEVRSKTDRLSELQEKMQEWVGNGAELAWLIDPFRKVVEVYRLGEAPEVHEQPTSVQASGPVAGFELVMGRVWN